MSDSVAVIGAGPSGLAAACALRHGGLPVTLLDGGSDLAERRHDVATDLGVGVGGAGLFSDGKFSYFPSGTNLYRLRDKAHLARAYQWCSRELDTVGIPVEPFPDAQHANSGQIAVEGNVKKYPSHYADLDQRRSLIESMSATVDGSLHTSALVHQVVRRGTGYEVTYRHRKTGQDAVLNVSGVVFASGRLGALDILERRLSSATPMRHRRYDLGIRIEVPSSTGFLTKTKAPDVKRIWANEDAEIRTFCTCRNGEVWNIPFWGLSAVSGRSDGPPSGFSNFGLLARFDGQQQVLGTQIWSEMRSHLGLDGKATFETLESFTSGSHAGEHHFTRPRPWHPRSSFQHGSVRQAIGETLYRVLRQAVIELLEWSPDLLGPDSVCISPVIEGTGSYPDIDEDLRIKDESIWCAGDIVGRFRGLVPALVSGYYAGLSAAQVLGR